MFSLDVVGMYEICLTIIFLVMVVAFFYILRFSVHERINGYLSFLKKAEKLIKSGEIFMLSSKLKTGEIDLENIDESVGIDTKQQDQNKKQNSSQYQSRSYDDFLNSLIKVVDKGVRFSVQEQSRLNFLKVQLTNYLSFLKERSYFFLILKNKIILMLFVALLIRWGILFTLNLKSDFKEFMGIDAFFVISDILLLIFVGVKLKRKFNLDFIESRKEEICEWMDLYFWKAFCDRGIKSLVSDKKTKMGDEVLKLYRKQLKEGVSYFEDIKEYLEECFSMKVEQEKNEFKKIVEFFPLIELVVVGGSVFMLISVPICTII